LVAWSSPPGIYQARVDPSGAVLDPDGVFVYASHDSDQDYLEPSVSVTFDGDNALLSWVNDDLANFEVNRLLYAGRTSVDGTPIDETPLRLSPEGEEVYLHTAGFDGTNHVRAWASYEVGIKASRVTPEGVILDPNGFLVEDGGEYQFIHRMEMGPINGRSTLVWSRFNAESNDNPDPVRAAQIATDGTVSLLPANAFPRGHEAVLATRPDGALLLWRGGDQSWLDHTTIVGTRLDDVGMPVGAEVAPASPASRQDVIAAASDGQNFFVLWTDTREPSGWALHGTRVGADGTLLDVESLQLTSERVWRAHVVFDGANFVVSWLDPPEFGDGDTCAGFNTVRVSPAGERLDLQPLQPPLCGRVAGASDGVHTLLAGLVSDEFDMRVLLLDQDGVVASEPALIPEYPHDQIAVSFDGSGYLLVWSQQDQLFGQRITQAGALEGLSFPIAHSGDARVSIAAGGGNHLVVSDTESGVEGTFVSSDGQLLEPEVLLIAPLVNSDCWWPDRTTCSESSVVFDGENFVVAWRDMSLPGHANSLDLYAAKVSPEGEVSPRFPISQAPEREGAAFLAVNDAGQVLAAYNRFMAGPPYDTRRAVATLLP
jgi:hypothetical protein